MSFSKEDLTNCLTSTNVKFTEFDSFQDPFVLYNRSVQPKTKLFQNIHLMKMELANKKIVVRNFKYNQWGAIEMTFYEHTPEISSTLKILHGKK